MTGKDPQHVVLIVGGAVSGSEAAFQLATRGVPCVVVEQNERPYGKIEDGLPRWHQKLRLQEEKKIDGKLSHPGVHFVPRTKLGVDLTLEETLSWGLSAVVLANGAWRDRPLPLPGIDRFIGKGFYYQNGLVYWFNHYPEPSYQGPTVAIEDGAIVVGGGLASLDVVKILMLETVVRALGTRGKAVDPFELEHRGIDKVLSEAGLTLSDLKLRGCTLIYRRHIEEMPVVEARENATSQQAERMRATRRKLLQNFARKYLFSFSDRRMPVGYLAEGERLAGLRLAVTETREGRLIAVPGSEYKFPSATVVSSIGSIPEPIPGLGMHGDLYRIKDERTGEVEGHDRVFVVGNAITGRGNIIASRRHGRVVSHHMLERYLLGTGSGYEEVLEEATTDTVARVEAVAHRLAGHAPLPAEQVAAVMARIKALQGRVGYPGSYREWIEQVRLRF